jgi:hypothetical protein
MKVKDLKFVESTLNDNDTMSSAKCDIGTFVVFYWYVGWYYNTESGFRDNDDNY